MTKALAPIIISGPSCSGKSLIAKRLKETGNYSVVNAITTRKKRPDDYNYKYVSIEEYQNHLDQNDLLVTASFLNNKYGILKSDYESIKPSIHPILILTSKSAAWYLENQKDAIWFFIDADDRLLIDRYKSHRKYKDKQIKDIIAQNTEDRKYKNEATYVLNSTDNNLESIIELIILLVEFYHTGGGLSHRIISLMLDCNMLLDNASKSNIKGASYDLSLGDEYYYDGKIKKLTDSSSFLTIEPYDYAIVSCKESARIPRDIIGKFGLSVSLFCQGIILSNGPQIDPGFNGTLFCLLFNTSNQAVHLKRGMHYATIEFNKLIDPAPPYKGNYQGKTHIIDYIPANALHGAINELKKEIERLKNESKLMQNIYLAVVGIMFAILSILLVLR